MKQQRNERAHWMFRAAISLCTTSIRIPRHGGKVPLRRLHTLIVVIAGDYSKTQQIDERIIEYEDGDEHHLTRRKLIRGEERASVAASVVGRRSTSREDAEWCRSC